MKICKEAAVTSAGSPTAEQLVKINQWTKSPLTAEEVYCFRVRLCDDLPDRDFERFDTAALAKLAELFRGKTGILDHEWSSQHQIARIFDTELCREQDVTFIRADCYMLRSEKNAAIIADIEGGIKKEVSVGCAMARATCGICGKPYGECSHRNGAVYDGQRCVTVLSEPTDAYEFSFVAVPAQTRAGVLKAKGGVRMTLKELAAGSPELCGALEALEQEAQFGRECRKALLGETVALGVLLDFGADEAVLEKAFSALDAQELRTLKRAMSEKAAALFPAKPQLPAGEPRPSGRDADYMI